MYQNSNDSLHCICFYLFTSDPGIAIGGGAKDQVVKDGGVRRDADAAAHHHRHLELVPVLVATTKWTLYSVYIQTKLRYTEIT